MKKRLIPNLQRKKIDPLSPRGVVWLYMSASRFATSPTYIQYGMLTPDQWRKLAVCEVSVPLSGDSNLRNTPSDERMGVLENGKECETCGYDNRQCPGHFGYIHLDEPVFNRLFLTYILKILQCICPYCSRPRMMPNIAEIQGLLTRTGLKRFKALVKKLSEISRCPYGCEQAIPSYFIDKETIVEYAPSKSQKTTESKRQGVACKPMDVYNIFCRMSEDTCNFLGLNSALGSNREFAEAACGTHVHEVRPEAMIYIILPVIPPCSRPHAIINGEQREDHLTDMYNSIININSRLREEREGVGKPRRRRGKANAEYDRDSDVAELTIRVCSLVDNQKRLSKLSSGGRSHKSIVERLIKKGGRIQGNCMAKRVDFSARSVIVGGGTMIKTGYLGVPKYVCRNLTKPEVVQDWNIEYLQSLVDNDEVSSVFRGGQERNLKAIQHKGRFLLHKGDIVERYLQEGDDVPFNRQPTLRYESIRSFKVFPTDEYTFRFSVCETPSFNADFDGDEMNMHVPQSTLATSEAKYLMPTRQHIVTGQKNSPVSGNVQDALVGCYLLTNTWHAEGQEDTLVPRHVVYNCYFASDISVERMNDAFIRAEKHYSEYVRDGFIAGESIPGKLFLSVLFPPDFDYTKDTGTNTVYPVVRIESGVILPTSGPLCKKVIGTSGQSVSHILWKEYGSDAALKFHGEAEFLIYNWLPTHGFSMGIADCMTTDRDAVEKILRETKAEVRTIVVSTEDKEARERKINAALNSAMNVGNTLAAKSMHFGERNALNVMRLAGAKGVTINCTQITAFVGQQNIDGNRVECTLSGGTRALPHFDENDDRPEARGLVSHGYLEGLTPAETFFHAGAGRRGIVDTSVKTATTGYIQKRVARLSEDSKAAIDGTVRTANGDIISFMYGDDGMNPKKLYSVKGVNHPFFVNVHHLAARLNKRSTSPVRTLAPDEIDLLLSFIQAGIPGVQTPVTEMTTGNIRQTLKELLTTTSVAEEQIPAFCREVKDEFECSKVEAGEMVGLIATHAVGEPAMQMTLNTFHLAGVSAVDITLGVPRLEEILRASKTSTPVCAVYLTDERLTRNAGEIQALEKGNVSLQEDSEEHTKNVTRVQSLKEESYAIVRDFCSRLEEIYVRDLLSSYEVKHVYEDFDPKRHASPVGIETYERYSEEWWVQAYKGLYGAVSTPEKWVIVLTFDRAKLYRHSISLAEITEAMVKHTSGNLTCIPSPEVVCKIEVHMKFAEIQEHVQALIDLPPGEDTKELITADNAAFFTTRDVALQMIKATVIRGVSGISKVYPREDKKTKLWVIDTQGSNILDILSLSGVDTRRTTSNDLYQVYDAFGIEATRNVLFREINLVFGTYGIYVNPRHIQLLVDRMTVTGEIDSVTERGISRDSGPVAKLSFEKPVDNAVVSALFTESDQINSVSASIMFGHFAKVGTGTVEVRRDESVI